MYITPLLTVHQSPTILKFVKKTAALLRGRDHPRYITQLYLATFLLSHLCVAVELTLLCKLRRVVSVGREGKNHHIYITPLLQYIGALLF